jgi:hypothetical protein
MSTMFLNYTYATSDPLEEECKCGCHSGGRHIMACLCRVCDYCGKRIKNHLFSKHEQEQHPEMKYKK